MFHAESSPLGFIGVTFVGSGILVMLFSISCLARTKYYQVLLEEQNSLEFASQ